MQIYAAETESFCQQHGIHGTQASKAWAQFVEQGLPTKKWPHWHYSNLARLLKTAYTPDQTAANAPARLTQLPFATYDIVLRNGQFDAQASTVPNGVKIQSIRDLAAPQFAAYVTQLDTQRHPMLNANLALASDGVYIEVQSQQCIDRPICLRYVIEPDAAHLAYHYHNVVACQAQSQCEILEYVEACTDQPTLLNSATQFHLQDNAQLTAYATSTNAQHLSHINAWHSWLGRDAHFNAHHLCLGNAMSRFDGQIYLPETGAHYQHYGAFSLQDKQHADFAFQVDHLADHTSSQIDFRGIAQDQATGIFNARALAKQNTKRLSIDQSSHNLLLSPKAKIYAQPALEIYTDDLVCTHGATFGQLDADALAYLQLRGIPQEAARQILQQAFLQNNVLTLANDAIQKWWLQWIT